MLNRKTFNNKNLNDEHFKNFYWLEIIYCFFLFFK